MDLKKIEDKKIVVKRTSVCLSMYEKWTEVNAFLSCGLQGVNRKYKIKLRDL